MNEPSTNTEHQLLHQLTDAILADRRAERRWRIIRFTIWILIFLALFYFIISPPKDNLLNNNKNEPYVSLVYLDGIIMPGVNFSARRVIPELNQAFQDQNAKGVVLVINSPGGSPVQASIIHDKIIQLKQKYRKKVVVIGEDALASGAYLVATAGDKIYVNQDTLTGSIGVIMSGFGFVDTIQKLGIDRRVFTAGANKNRLDPFKPLNPADVEKIKKLLNVVHQDFIQDVIQSRGKLLKGDRNEIFSGDFWTGAEAAQLGLVDGTGDLWTVIKNEFNVSHYRNYTEKGSFIENLFKEMNSELKLHLQASKTQLQEELP